MSLPASIAEKPSVAPRTIAIAAVVLGAIVIAGLWTMRSAPASQKDASIPPSSTSSAPPAPATEPATAQPAAARPPIPAPVEQPTPAPPPAATAPADSQPTEQKSVPKTRPAAAAHDAVAIVTAQLCRPLATSGNWTCTPASSQMTPGVVFFYTRVISAADTTIEHRWYRNDRLHQNVTLQVRANGAGYRTYSRTTISPERAGDWRVELRAADGTVLHEERFSIAQ